MSFNQVMLIGNLGGDPEIKGFADGGRIASFSVATSESWKDKASGERKERTEWHRVTVQPDGLVGVVERYLRKGSKVHIVGQLRTRKWTGTDGVERYATEVVIGGLHGQLTMLDGAAGARGQQDAGRPAGEGSGGNAGPRNAEAVEREKAAKKPAAFDDDMDDDVPF